MIILITLLILNLLFPLPSLSLTKTSSTTVTAAIEENTVTIFGYTSPLSKVELENPRVYAQTYSDSSGYFEFDRTLLPKYHSELCLTTTDADFRRSTPLCLPPPPPTDYHVDIGPILLPPTLTLDAPNLKPNSTTIASGQSIPNSTLDIHFFQADKNPLSFPKQVSAFSLPKLTLNTDDQGNFNLTLPTAYSTDYRLFATVNYLDNLSPKSNTLAYSLPSLLYLFWLQYRFPIILTLLLITSLALLFYLIRLHQKPLPRFLPVPPPLPAK